MTLLKAGALVAATAIWALSSACSSTPTHIPDVREIAHRAVEQGRRTSNATSAIAVVIDARDARLLAIASSSKNGDRAPAQALISTPTALCSLASPIIISSAIMMGRTRMDERVDTENGVYDLRAVKYVDRSPLGRISAEQVIINASLVGQVKIGESLGVNLYNGLKIHGISEKHLPNADAMLQDQDAMAELVAGYTMLATPLEIAMAYRKLSQDRMFRGVLKRAVREGTGKLANSAIYSTAGMTGNGGRGAPTASFAGFAPVENPRIVVYVRVDQPEGTLLGGVHAAPIFRNIVEAALPMVP